MYGHMTFFHSGKAFKPIFFYLRLYLFYKLLTDFFLFRHVFFCLIFEKGHEVFKDYMEYMTDLQLRLQNVSNSLTLSSCVIM